MYSNMNVCVEGNYMAPIKQSVYLNWQEIVIELYLYWTLTVKLFFNIIAVTWGFPPLVFMYLFMYLFK